MSKTECPICGAYKKPWFDHCFECTENLSNIPRCGICNVEIEMGHILCKKHWKEHLISKASIKENNYAGSIEQNYYAGHIAENNYAPVKKNIPFQEVYEGIYYFNNYKVRSKSELLICFFLRYNDIPFDYEPSFTITNEMRPDFVIHDQKGNTIIIEHFGSNDPEYQKKCDWKRKEYNEFCDKNKNYHFIETDEEDIKNLKDNLGQKLNTTPLQKPIWK